MKPVAPKLYILLLMACAVQHAASQNTTPLNKLPVNVVQAAADTGKPLVLYITGDGGWNKFSKNLCQELAAKGYPVVSLNAKEYFWKKKTPAQTALDVALLIRTYQHLWRLKKILLIGYSFGADVMPVIYNLFPADLCAQVTNISLLSPSANTDFEIHISVMFGGNVSGGESVPAAVNKIINRPLTLIFGKEENDFPLAQLKIKNYTTVRLEGGHHYDGDEAGVCNTILAHVPKN